MLIWYSPLLLGTLLSITTVAGTTWDSGLYLLNALDLFNGHGFTDPQRPVFTALLALSFNIFGPNVWAGIIVVRLFFVANTWLIFFFTKKLFDEKAAFIATTLLVTSWFFLYISYNVLLDNIYPFFTLAGIYTSILLLQENKYKWAIISGVLFALAYLTKVSAILHIPFPFIVFLFHSNYRNNSDLLKKTILLYLVFALLAGSWHIIAGLLTQVQGDKDFLRQGFYQLERLLNVLNYQHGILAVFSSLGKAILIFWEKYILQDMALGPLALTAWLFVGVKSFSSVKARYLFICCLLFLPGMVHLGLVFMRMGQAAVLIILSYIAIAYLIIELYKSFLNLLTKYFSKRQTLTKEACSVCLICLTLALSWTQISLVERSSNLIVNHTTALGCLLTGHDFNWRIKGKFNTGTKDAGNWILENVSKDQRILTGLIAERPVTFFSQKQYQISRYRYKQVLFNGKGKKPGIKTHERGRGKDIYFIWLNSRKDKVDRFSKDWLIRLYFLDENFIWQMRRKKAISYFITDWRSFFLGYLFDKMPQTSLVLKLRDNMRIYKMGPIKPPKEFKTMVGREVISVLKQIKANDPKRYQLIRDSVFRDYFELSAKEIDSALQGMKKHHTFEVM